MNPTFWRGRRVFVTGHSGFKGTWLTEWLNFLGAEVTGFSLPDDVRDLSSLTTAMKAARPEVVFHLAAQAFVRASLEDPVTTYTTNVIGTVHALEAIRATPSVAAAIMVTSDKCYANRGESRPFSEDDRLGGSDPYSSSKAAAELAIASYRDTYFSAPGAPRIVSVRAGNVIGGGDWGADRLVPDLVRAFRAEKVAFLRYPEATRPWQFVLDALHGYMLTAERACERSDVPAALNFGPSDGAHTVEWLAERVAARWGEGAAWARSADAHPTEAATLALDSTLAREYLSWSPRLNVEEAIDWTVDWYKSAAPLTLPQLRLWMERPSS